MCCKIPLQPSDFNGLSNCSKNKSLFVTGLCFFGTFSNSVLFFLLCSVHPTRWHGKSIFTTIFTTFNYFFGVKGLYVFFANHKFSFRIPSHRWDTCGHQKNTEHLTCRHMVVMMDTWTGSEKEIEKENGKETETEIEIETGKTETENVTEKETGIATEKENEKDMLMVSAHSKVMLLLSHRFALW